MKKDVTFRRSKDLSKRRHKQESGAHMSISEPNVYKPPTGIAMGLLRKAVLRVMKFAVADLLML
jgi:hypothetical protein